MRNIDEKDKLNIVLQNIFNICFLVMFLILSFTIFYINNYYYYLGILFQNMKKAHFWQKSTLQKRNYRSAIWFSMFK